MSEKLLDRRSEVQHLMEQALNHAQVLVYGLVDIGKTTVLR